MFRIGEFSKLSRTTIKALRYYDEIGLLKPEKTDDFTSYRFYTTDQLVKLHKIQSLRQMGISIEAIKLIMSGKSVGAILEQRKAELIDEITNVQGQLSRIEFILSGEEEMKEMNYQAAIKEVPACNVYSRKMKLTCYADYNSAIPETGEKVMKKYPELECSTPGYCFIRYLDGEYREKDISIEFCEAVTKLMPDFDDIKFFEIPAATVVSVFHKGAYDGLSKAYAFAFDWVKNNGYTPVELPRENYIDGIWNKESVEEYLTEIQIPIIKK